MFNRLATLKHTFGFNARRVIDIGANTGDWAITIKTIFPDAKVTSFEGNPNCEQYLKEKGLEHHIVLLGRDDADSVPFYTLKNNTICTGSSTYRENTTHYVADENVKTLSLSMRRLDRYIQENEHIDLMKLDVQGGELDVLDGLSDAVLKNTDFIVLEVSLVSYNTGSPLMAEVVSYMHRRGFNAYDLMENHYRSDICLQCDILFLNRDSEWCKTIARTAEQSSSFRVINIFEK